MLLTVLLMAHLMLWLSDPNWIVLLFLLIHLRIFGAAVVQSQAVKVVL